MCFLPSFSVCGLQQTLPDQLGCVICGDTFYAAAIVQRALFRKAWGKLALAGEHDVLLAVRACQGRVSRAEQRHAPPTTSTSTSTSVR